MLCFDHPTPDAEREESEPTAAATWRE